MACAPDRPSDVLWRLGSFAADTGMMRVISATGRGRRGITCGIALSQPAERERDRERERERERESEREGEEQGILME